MANHLTVGTSEIRSVNGLFSLNDLHKASGGNQKHKPALFLRLDQTKALIDEIAKGTDVYLSTNSEKSLFNSGNPALKVIRGAGGGTYACKELVIAYAAWISPAFHLKVIRVFLEQQGKKPSRVGRGLKAAISEAVKDAVSEATPAPLALPARTPIREVHHLSFFRKSGRKGSPYHGPDSFSVWWDYPQHLKDLPWSEGTKVGRDFFGEVAELAEYDEHAAYLVLVSVLGVAWELPAGNPQRNSCVEYGFAQAMAVAMMTGLRAIRKGAPAYVWGM